MYNQQSLIIGPQEPALDIRMHMLFEVDSCFFQLSDSKNL